MMPNILYSISEGLFISIFSVVIVFLILLLITLVVQSLQKIREKQEIIKEPEEEKKELLPSGAAPVFYNRTAWAKTYLKKALRN